MDRVPVIESVDNEMALVLRQKTTTERLQIGFGMWRSARELLAALLRRQHPSWSEQDLAAEVALRLSHGAR